MHEVTISNAVSTSLEALALWIIYNYEDKWSTEGTTRESPAKFTGMTKGNRICSGWNSEVIAKYNEFVTFVRNGRDEDDGHFEDIFKHAMMKEYEDRLMKKNGMMHNTGNIVCANDLDSKLERMSTMIYERNEQKVPRTCNIQGVSDTASTVSQSSVSAASFHTVQNSSSVHSAKYFEAL